MAGAVAPKAKLGISFAPNNGDKGFLDALSAAIHDATAGTNARTGLGTPDGSSIVQALAQFTSSEAGRSSH